MPQEPGRQRRERPADPPGTAPAARGDGSPSILQRIAAGDPSAPQVCLDTYGNLVWSIARPMLGSGPEAEDAVQDVFIQLWQHAARFEPAKGSEATFVSMIARRRVVDRVRRRQRQPDSEPLPELVDPGSDDPGLRAERSDDAERALAALASLPAARRQVLGEALLSGRTHAEIAERSGLPLGTVKTHVRRGLQRLRELLDVPDPSQGEDRNRGEP